jgi:hypothetical protein
LIDEIVVGEESDLLADGTPISHSTFTLWNGVLAAQRPRLA